MGQDQIRFTSPDQVKAVTTRHPIAIGDVTFGDLAVGIKVAGLQGRDDFGGDGDKMDGGHWVALSG